MNNVAQSIQNRKKKNILQGYRLLFLLYLISIYIPGGKKSSPHINFAVNIRIKKIWLPIDSELLSYYLMICINYSLGDVYILTHQLSI